MDQFFRIALCICLCLGGLQATPVRSARAEPPCTISVADVGFHLLNDVSCVSQGAKDYNDMCLWVVAFFPPLPIFKTAVGKREKGH